MTLGMQQTLICICYAAQNSNMVLNYLDSVAVRQHKVNCRLSKYHGFSTILSGQISIITMKMLGLSCLKL